MQTLFCPPFPPSLRKTEKIEKPCPLVVQDVGLGQQILKTYRLWRKEEDKKMTNCNWQERPSLSPYIKGFTFEEGGQLCKRWLSKSSQVQLFLFVLLFFFSLSAHRAWWRLKKWLQLFLTLFSYHRNLEGISIPPISVTDCLSSKRASVTAKSPFSCVEQLKKILLWIVFCTVLQLFFYFANHCQCQSQY